MSPWRGASREPEGEPELLVPTSQMERELDERIALGQQLLDRDWSVDDDHLSRLYENSDWNSYNVQLLRSRFSTAKVADSYLRAEENM